MNHEQQHLINELLKVEKSSEDRYKKIMESLGKGKPSIAEVSVTLCLVIRTLDKGVPGYSESLFQMYKEGTEAMKTIAKMDHHDN